MSSLRQRLYLELFALLNRTLGSHFGHNCLRSNPEPADWSELERETGLTVPGVLKLLHAQGLVLTPSYLELHPLIRSDQRNLFSENLDARKRTEAGLRLLVFGRWSDEGDLAFCLPVEGEVFDPSIVFVESLEYGEGEAAPPSVTHHEPSLGILLHGVMKHINDQVLEESQRLQKEIARLESVFAVHKDLRG